MSIAACYVSSEAVVFGTDSRTTVTDANGTVVGLYDHAQKLFEVGHEGSLGVCTWGNGSVGSLSHRALIASLSQDLRERPIASVAEGAQRLAEMAWRLYSDEFRGLATSFMATIDKANLTAEVKERVLEKRFRPLTLGYCIGGTWDRSVIPDAYEIIFTPQMAAALTSPPMPVQVPRREIRFWGSPGALDRLIKGIDPTLRTKLLESGKWTGTTQELDDLISKALLRVEEDLPLRDAIDWVHAAISMTIKAGTFSGMLSSCGGAVELAAITCDRRFRWVKHKGLDDAL